MSDINHMHERVEAAKKQLGLTIVQQNKHGERIIERVDRLGSAFGEVKAEHDRNKKELERLRFENEQLRGMLNSLLASVETDGIIETMRDLDAKVSALLQSHSFSIEVEKESVLTSEVTTQAVDTDALESELQGNVKNNAATASSAKLTLTTSPAGETPEPDSPKAEADILRVDDPGSGVVATEELADEIPVSDDADQDHPPVADDKTRSRTASAEVEARYEPPVPNVIKQVLEMVEGLSDNDNVTKGSVRGEKD